VWLLACLIPIGAFLSLLQQSAQSRAKQIVGDWHRHQSVQHFSPHAIPAVNIPWISQNDATFQRAWRAW
jgi:hypothetical protein